MAEPSAEATAAHEIYRQTVMGDHLCDVLESFMEAGKLNEAMAHTVLRQFDLSMLEALQHVGAKASINANLKTYRYFDNVWQFTLENVRLRMTGAGYSMPDICCDKAKVVCVDCKQFEPKAPS